MQKTKKPRHSPGKSNRVRRGKAKSLSAQQTIPYLVMHPDGVCQLPGGIYTKTVEYSRISEYIQKRSSARVAVFKCHRIVRIELVILSKNRIVVRFL